MNYLIFFLFGIVALLLMPFVGWSPTFVCLVLYIVYNEFDKRKNHA